MRLLSACFLLALFVCVTQADELDLEVNISYIEPYENFVPGFSASIRPDLLKWGRFSLGGGLGIHVSSRFSYETPRWILYLSDYPLEDPANDTTYIINAHYYDDNLIEIINYEVYLEGRLQLLGDDEDAQWKAWLSLNIGFVDNSSIRTQHRTYATTPPNEVYDVDDDRISWTEHAANLYLSPGLSIGIGNFIVGYRHWIHFDESSLIKGEPARQLGTIRVGYRFIW